MNDLLYQKAYEKALYWLNNIVKEEDKEEINKIINNRELLIDAFYDDLEFGTGGLRGIIGIGSNRMNNYVVQIATQGLCNFLNKTFPNYNKNIAIAYDSRNKSREFAFAAARVFAANNFNVYIFNDIKPTPMLSYAIRKLNCVSGVVITASHNPKEYNGYKAYGPDGGQFISPYDKYIIEEVKNIKSFNEVKTTTDTNKIKILDDSFDDEYLNEISKLIINKELIKKHSNLKFVYTPLHGTGYKIMPKCLKKLGFNNVYLVEEQCIPDGNFPTVKSPNPEEHSAFELALKKAKEVDADVILATDPDADRLAVAVKDHNSNYIILNGNQTAAIITYYLLENLKSKNQLKGNEFIVKTIVTTDLLTEIAKHYNVEIYDVLTGFKYIAQIIRENESKKKYICGGEESYGFLVGDYVRDKDAISTCAIIAEVTCWAREYYKTLFELLLEIYNKFGLYYECQVSLTKKGIEGQNEIKELMNNFRNNPPKQIASENVIIIKDYLLQKEKNLITHEIKDIILPKSDVIQFITDKETKVSIRPSGTEPKIKFYIQIKSELPSINNYNEKLEELKFKAEQIKKSLKL